MNIVKVNQSELPKTITLKTNLVLSSAIFDPGFCDPESPYYMNTFHIGDLEVYGGFQWWVRQVGSGQIEGSGGPGNGPPNGYLVDTDIPDTYPVENCSGEDTEFGWRGIASSVISDHSVNVSIPQDAQPGLYDVSVFFQGAGGDFPDISVGMDPNDESVQFKITPPCPTMLITAVHTS